MPELYIPDSARINLNLESQLEKLNQRHEWLRHFDRELKAMDPHLSLVKASEQATEPGLIPGYWHIKRDNPRTMATYIPLRGDKGEFVEPGSEHLDFLRRNDLQRPGAFKELMERVEATQKAREREQEVKAQQRREEMAERIEAMERPSVSMNGKWTNSVKGVRGKSEPKRTTD